MTMQDVAAELERAKAVLEHRAEAGLHDDVPAGVRWGRGTRIVAMHANGRQVLTDMPSELELAVEVEEAR